MSREGALRKSITQDLDAGKQRLDLSHLQRDGEVVSCHSGNWLRLIPLSTVRIEFQWPTTAGLCLDLRIRVVVSCRIMSYLIRWKRVGSWGLKWKACEMHHQQPSPELASSMCPHPTSVPFWDSHVMFWGYFSISFPFSVGWAPLVESWLIQRMDLGRMVKLGGSKIHDINATRQQTSYFN